MSGVAGMHSFDRAVTLDEVAAALGVSRERARQIEHQALQKLRKAMKRRGLTAADFEVVDNSEDEVRVAAAPHARGSQ